MALPMELTDQILTARDELLRSASGELSLAARRRIWQRMGPLDADPQTGKIGEGHLRRARLFVLCTEHVLPIWVSAYPQHQGPQIMLKIAMKVLNASLSRDIAKKARDEFWSELDGWEDDQGYEFEPQYVGYGSAKAVTAALNDVLFSDDVPQEGETEWEHDPSEWHSDFYDSLPYKGNSPQEIARLRDYWLWYLDEAVPAAYESVAG